MDPRLPLELQVAMAAYLTALERDCPGLLEAWYVHGSVALDAYDPGQSDVDCLCLLSRRCTAADLRVLANGHQEFAQAYPDARLECSYLQWKDLGKPQTQISPGPMYHDGRLARLSRLDTNPVTWWLLKTRGIAVHGSKPDSLDYDLNWDVVIAWMSQNMNSYWRRFTYHPSRIVWLFNDYGVQWTVLGLRHLPLRWHRLIQEALNIRRDTQSSLYRSKIARGIEAWHFLRYVITLTNKLSV